MDREQITDGALRTLRETKLLHTLMDQEGVLDLRDTRVTDMGVKRLQQALPRCNIFSGKGIN
jgi:hypothetical protein